MMELVVVGTLDPDQAWDGHSSELHDRYGPGAELPATLLGAFGGAYRHEGGFWRLARDPLGINKVYWAILDDALMVAARPKRLVERGARFEDIRAFPRGAVIDSDDGSTAK